MALYLVQHGKNLPKDQDPEQSLSPEGREESYRIANTAARLELPLRLIQHSPKTRAKQTADILAEQLGPQKGVQEREGIKALDDVVPVAHELRQARELMLVGHQPFMGRLATYLVTGYQEPGIVAFQNGGIVCLDLDEESRSWYIRWTLLPEVMPQTGL
jgi:phosphohistidine phosphatase